MEEPVRPSGVSHDDSTHFLLLSLCSFLILFVPLHRGDLSGYDDALYAHQAKEMIRSGDWWNVRFNGSLNFEYPPMFMWLEALSMTLLGVSDFAAKVPAALAGFGTIVLVYFLVRELTDEPWTPRLAMLVLVSTQYFMKYATHAMTDVPFAFFFTLAMLLYVKGLRTPRYFVLAGLPLACALLTRSVIGMIPIGIVLVHLLGTRRYDLILSRHSLWFLLTAFSLPAAWFAVEYHLYGPSFLQGHVSFVAGKLQSGESFQAWNAILRLLVFPRLLVTTYWPWLPFTAVGFYQYSRAAISRRDSGAVLLVAWVLCAVVPFSLAQDPFSRYFMPVFPALAILSATILNDWIPLRRKPVMFKALYSLGSLFVLYAAVFPMTLLRATDMRQLAPVTDAHTPPQERVLLYTFGAREWGFQNQLLWYGNRYTELVTDLSEVRSRLVSGRNTVAAMNTEAAGQLLAALRAEKSGGITVLAESEKFVCLKLSGPAN
ncbi:MAG TPA: glycosyltransferase family 39 protein [Candidatus Acidoferrales bacterium]